jgi:hypothetical protein
VQYETKVQEKCVLQAESLDFNMRRNFSEKDFGVPTHDSRVPPPRGDCSGLLNTAAGKNYLGRKRGSAIVTVKVFILLSHDTNEP